MTIAHGNLDIINYSLIFYFDEYYVGNNLIKFREPYYRDTAPKIPVYMCVYLSSVTADNGIVTPAISAHV